MSEGAATGICPCCGTDQGLDWSAASGCDACGWQGDAEGIEWPALPQVPATPPAKGGIDVAFVDAMPGGAGRAAAPTLPGGTADRNPGRRRRVAVLISAVLVCSCLSVGGYLVLEDWRASVAAAQDAETLFKVVASPVMGGAARRDACRQWAGSLDVPRRAALARALRDRADRAMRALGLRELPWPASASRDVIIWLDMASALDPGLLERALDLRCEVLATAGQEPTGPNLDECRALLKEAIDCCSANADRDRLGRKARDLEAFEARRGGFVDGGPS